MSWEATTWASGKTVGNSGRKFTLLILANDANKDGVVRSDVSQAYLAEVTEQTDRSVRRHLIELESMGLLIRQRTPGEAGRFGIDQIQLNMHQRTICPVDNLAAGQIEHQRTLCPPDTVTASFRKDEEKEEDKDKTLSPRAREGHIPVPKDLTLDEVSRQTLGMQGIREIDPKLVAEFVAYHETLEEGQGSRPAPRLTPKGWQAELRKWILREHRVYGFGRRRAAAGKAASRIADVGSRDHSSEEGTHGRL